MGKASGALVCQGIIDGENGADGFNMSSVPMYRRSATALTNSDRPTGSLTYTFSTGKLTGASSNFNSWSQSVPAVVAGTKLYVIMAVARSQSDTDSIESTEWSTPVEYVSDGMNSAPVLIYKRDASVSDKPSDGAVYNFKTGALTGTLNGWSVSIPATDSNHNPCWVRHAMAVGIGETDTIDASEWGDATKLVEDGAKGDKGDKGDTGDKGDKGDTGGKGDDAVTYRITLAGSRFYYNPNTGLMYVNIKGKVYKTTGGTTAAYTGLTRNELTLYYLLSDGSFDYVPDVNSVNNGYTVSGSTFSSAYYNATGYSEEQSLVVVLKIDGTEVARESIQVELCGENGRSIKGDTGRMYYLAGKFPEKAPYSRTSALCPVVYHNLKWWYLNAESASSTDTPSDSSDKWVELEDYGVVLTDAIFVKQFAQFGAAIITGDWLISCHGMIGSQMYGGTVEEPDEYNGKAAYTYFDPLYPEGFNAFTLGIIQDEVNISHYTSWTKVTDFFKLTPGTYTFKITCYANSSDTVHVRLFEGDSTKDAYYLCGTTNEEATVFTKTLTIGSSRSDFNVRAAVETTGELGYVVSVEIIPTDTRFVPNFALDLKTGAVYQGDAHIRGTVTTIGPTSKIIIADGVIQFFGTLSFPNIVLGVDADGCAVLNFYDKAGNFKYGLGPDKIFENQSQAESMTLMYYDIDEGSYDVGGFTSAMIVTLYRYMFKNQAPASSSFLYRYLAKIVAGVYGPGTYCASGEDAQRFNRKFFRNGFSSSTKLQNSDLYGGGIVVTTNRPQCGYFTRLSTFLFSTSLDDIDNCGYTVLQDSDVSRSKDGQVYRYYRNGSQIFYFDISSGVGSVGYNSGETDAYTLNLCVDPTEGSDDVLMDPVYYFVMQYIDSNGNVNGSRTFCINKKKLSRILSNAGYSL